MVRESEMPQEPASSRPATGDGYSHRPPRGRNPISPRPVLSVTPTTAPAVRPPLSKPRGHRFARWLRYKREFLSEELTAYKQVAIAIVVGILIVLSFMVIKLPRTTMRLIEYFGGN